MIVIMKRSIKRLPKRTQEELAVLQELILQYLVNVRMIILYGSYARGEYVIWDETYDERGGLTYYQSDLDILVICDTGDAIKAENHANAFVVPRYDKRMEGRRHPAPPQIIVESTTTFNRAIRRKHYFFYEALRDGILLYDDGTFQIGKPEKLPYREIKQYAEEEYAGCFDMAEGLLRHGKLAQVEKEYKLGSFFLHQACERYYKTYMLVHSGDVYKRQGYRGGRPAAIPIAISASYLLPAAYASFGRRHAGSVSICSVRCV